jgi:hypothetical protein
MFGDRDEQQPSKTHQKAPGVDQGQIKRREPQD